MLSFTIAPQDGFFRHKTPSANSIPEFIDVLPLLSYAVLPSRPTSKRFNRCNAHSTIHWITICFALLLTPRFSSRQSFKTRAWASTLWTPRSPTPLLAWDPSGGFSGLRLAPVSAFTFPISSTNLLMDRSWSDFAITSRCSIPSSSPDTLYYKRPRALRRYLHR